MTLYLFIYSIYTHNRERAVFSALKYFQYGVLLKMARTVFEMYKNLLHDIILIIFKLCIFSYSKDDESKRNFRFEKKLTALKVDQTAYKMNLDQKLKRKKQVQQSI